MTAVDFVRSKVQSFVEFAGTSGFRAHECTEFGIRNSKNSNFKKALPPTWEGRA